MKAAAVAEQGILQTAGLNDPAPFDMKRHLHGAHLGQALASAASPRPFNVLTVLVDFPDKEHVEEAQYFQDLIYGETGSVRAYYQGQSQGRLDITPNQTLVWMRLPRDYTFYVNNNYGFGSYPHNSQGMVADIVAQLVQMKVDLSIYDNDGDGYVDGLLVVHAGTGAELSGKATDMWSHKWQVQAIPVGSVYVSEYAVMPEYWVWPTTKMTIGVFCHEAGHLFGLPDLYDIDGSSYGLHYWDIMATGSWLGSYGDHPCGFSAPQLLSLGFREPRSVPFTRQVTLGPNEFVRIPVAHGDTGKFYTVGYRRKAGQDAKLPFGGIQVCRVDHSMHGNASEWTPGADPTRHYEVAQIQPDNEWALERRTAGKYGLRGDLYPLWKDDGSGWVTIFGPTTEPSSKWYDGSETNVSMKVVGDVTQTSDTITVEVSSMSLQGDVNGDGVVDAEDINALVQILFFGAPATEGADVLGDGELDARDLNKLIDIVYYGG